MNNDTISYTIVDEEKPFFTPLNISNGTPTGRLDRDSMATLPTNELTQPSTHSFDDIVQSYIKTHNPKLFILTPCFGGVNYVNYTICLINTLQIFQQLKFPIQVEFCKNDSLVSRARNNLVAKAMNDPTTTHIIFIDNDISWDPIDILKLVVADKPLCGGIYPLKNYNWNHLLKKDAVESMLTRKNNSQLNTMISDEQMVQFNLLKYNINYLDTTLVIENNIARVKHLATGFMMIQRKTIEQMYLAFPSTKYRDDVGFLHGTEHDFAYALFDCGVEEGHYFSEDWLFCHRWSKMKGEIFVNISINLTHTGIEDYRGSFISSVI